MGLFEIAQQDMADLMSDPDLGVSIALKSPDGQTATIYGRHIKHNQKFDFNQGMPVNTLNATMSISTKQLATQFPNYPFRNLDSASEHFNKVDMKNHIAEALDVSGAKCTYKVVENAADETLGLVVLTLTPHRE